MHEDPAEWLREIAKRAREDPRTRFLTLALFLSEIVVRTKRYVELPRLVPGSRPR